MSTMNKNGTAKGKRYTDAEKQEVVDFIENYNKTNGRGGQTAASNKFGVSQLTVASWLKKAGSPAAKKGRPAKVTSEPKAPKAPKEAKPAKGERVKRAYTKRSAAAAAPSAAATGSATGGFSAKLSSLLAVSQQIEKAEAELATLRSKFDSLKSSL